MSVPVPDTPVIDTRAGRVQGFWRGSSAAFYGIPYAAAPFRENRFRSPRPHPGWTGVRPCTTPGATPQRRQFAEVTAIPEPCVPGEETLNVNVFTPAPGDGGAGLPVFVWIHGGGFKAGSSPGAWYDGSSFNRHGVVVVSISYRLGFDGFGWIADAPHNRGVRDQIAALEWVRDNIRGFGGNPARVTIGGQSAGGASVRTLMAAPLARGLFQAAISQSGALRACLLDDAERAGRRLAELAGVPCRVADLALLEEDRILDLQDEVERDTPHPHGLSEVVADLVATGGLSIPFRPYVDGDILPCPVEDAPRLGIETPVPLLAGSTANEFTMAGPMFEPLVAGHGPADVADVITAALGDAGGGWLTAYAQLAGGSTALMGQLLTDHAFRIPLLPWANSRAAPTWLYDFRYVDPTTGLAPHCAELPFAWDHLDAERVEMSAGPNPPQSLADAMHGDWVRFLATHELPWAPWDSKTCVGMTYAVPPLPGAAYALEAAVLAATARFG